MPKEKKLFLLFCFIIFLKPSQGFTTTITSLPIIITTPGVYNLDCDLENASPSLTSIVVQSDGVQINGNGYSINGSTNTTSTNYGIRVIDHTDIKISNLSIVGHQTGIIIGDTVNAKISDPTNYGLTVFRASSRIKIEKVNLARQTFQGIHIRADDVLVDNCAMQHIGGTTNHPHAFATAVFLQADNCKITNNRIFGLYPSGNGEGVGIAIYQGDSSIIRSNVITFPRRSTYGRNFGIWSRSRNWEDVFISKNTVNGADYAFGPYGVFTDNKTINTACRMFVDRIFSFNANQVSGWLTTDNNDDLTDPTKMQCPDDINYAIDRASDNPNDLSVYSVALAYAEKDPEINGAWSLAWILRADEFGHSTANTIVNSSPTAGRSQADYDAAVALLPAVRSLTGG